MLKKNQYVFNPETLAYELVRETWRDRLRKVVILILSGLAVFVIYYLLHTQVFNLQPPKTAYLVSQNKELLARVEQINQKSSRQGIDLAELQMRDNILYRPVFGMGEIKDEVRNAGFGGVDRYSYLEKYENGDILISAMMKLDVLSKKAYVQSHSFDEVSLLSKRAGEMASCIPSIYPVCPGSGVRQSSPFGYRQDPFTHVARLHKGIDIVAKKGTPIYSTGNGVVVKVAHTYGGYGNFVVVDHGFGYQTRYAHLKETKVIEGQRVMRGNQIGTMGSTGRSDGVHLHYEVIYRDHQVNPWNYFTNNLDEEQYRAMIRSSIVGDK